MATPIVLAYLAGALDADGYFTIKVTIHQHWSTGAHERVGLKQVTPQVPKLLHEVFGGSIALQKPSVPRGRPLYVWSTSDRLAATVCAAVLPYLRIKCRQATKLLELAATKKSQMRNLAFWFEQEHPDWRTMDMLTASEAASVLGRPPGQRYLSRMSPQKLLYIRGYGRNQSLIPKLFVEQLASRLAADGRRNVVLPQQLIDLRSRICAEIRELNRVGTAEPGVG